MQIFFRTVFLSVFFMLLAGCAHLSNAPTSNYHPQSWKQRQITLNQIHEWHINGAFSIQQPNRTTIANYEWQQQHQNYHLRIYSSLDLYGIHIVGHPGQVTLWHAQNHPAKASSPEQLMQQELGWRLPVSNLYYWLRGLPAPGPYEAKFDSYGHLAQLTQQGWQITYVNYTNIGKVDLPESLILNYPALRMKIIIKSWQI